MARWAPGAQPRLERAALELFVEQGFAETTVPQIAARAGLATRTFFRHFADKREVLFGVESELPGVVDNVMHEIPSDATPYRSIVEGLSLVVASRFDGRFQTLRTRRAVIRSDRNLRERELAKQAVLADTIQAALRRRGVDQITATLAGQTAANVFGVAIDRWLDQPVPTPDLASNLKRTLEQFETLVGRMAETGT